MTEANERFQRLMQFARNHRPNGGFSNLYLFRKSVNGVTTGEAYGMNQMTDYGFEQFFSNKTTFPTNLYVGYGSDESFNFKTNSTLIQPSITTAATVNSSALSTDSYFNYPMWYDSNSKLISLMCKYLDCYFKDQSSGGPTTDITITEYGIGSAINNLWTHSWLYDLQGDRITNFTKLANERLDIEVFFVLTYDETLITDGWTNGRYCAMTTMYRFIRQHMGYDDSSVYTYKRDNSSTSRSVVSRIIEMGTNSNATVYHTISPFEIYKSTGAENGYIDGFIQKSPGFICIEQQTQPSTALEPVDVQVKSRWVRKVDHTQDMGGSRIEKTDISRLFGLNDEINTPFTNLKITTCNLYNRNTATYSNPAPYVNSNTHDYTETPLQTVCAVPIYYTNTTTGNVITAYVHCNHHPDDPIVKFENGNVAIYATDKYWDRSSWYLITNPSNIPTAEQTRHFYITSSNENLNPVRESKGFELIADDGKGNQTDRSFYVLEGIYKVGQYSTCENYDKGYFVIHNRVYVPSKSVSYTIPGLSSSEGSGYSWYNHHFCYKDMIVSFTYGSGSNTAAYYFTNLSDLVEQGGTGNITTTKYLAYDAINGFSSGLTDMFARVYKTETLAGVIGMQSTMTDEFVVMYIEFETDNPGTGIIGHLNRRFKYTSRMGCCIQDPSGTKNRIAYYTSDGNIYVEEYDVSDNQWYRTHNFELPSGYAEPTIMFGLRDKLWVTDGASYMIMYDLENYTSGTGTACESRFPRITNRNDTYSIEMTSVNDAIVIYQFTANSITNGYYILYNYPLNTYQIPYDDTNANRQPRLFMKLKYIRNNTLALIMGHGYNYGGYTGSYRAIADFGKYINPPIDQSVGTDISSDYNSSTYSGTGTSVGARDGVYTFGPYYIIGDYGIGSNSDKVGFNQTPIEYALTHRIVGTTSTISAINLIRHVSDKQWNIEVTNIKNTNYGDSGKPPGSIN